MSGATCVAIVSSEPVVIVEQTPEVDTSTEINLGAFIAPEAQPTLLERYVDQSVSVESSQTEESTSLPGLLERYVDQSLSPLEQLLSGE